MAPRRRGCKQKRAERARSGWFCAPFWGNYAAVVYSGIFGEKPMRAFSVDEVGDYLADGYWAETGGWHPPVLDDKISVNLTGLSAANQAIGSSKLAQLSALGVSSLSTTMSSSPAR